MKATSVPLPQPATARVQAQTHSTTFRWFLLFFSFLGMVAVFLAAVRPWYQTWGATQEEQSMALPGDQFVPLGYQETRAITVNAPSWLVWKWVAQLGQDRGGFYSYDILENLAGCQMPTKDYLRPDKQTWKSGDRLWMYPSSRGIAISGAPLQTYIPGRAIGFATTQKTSCDSNWTFVLDPIDTSNTRLIVRGRTPPSVMTFAELAGNVLAFEPAHFAMEKRMMIGIKELSEGSDRGRMWNHMEVGLWVIVFGLWIASIVFTLRRESWLRPFFGFVLATALFQVLTLGQPPVWLGALLVAGLVWVLWRPKGVAGEPASVVG